MKSKNIQQEILVFTQTSFVQKALIENIGNNKKSYPAEEFEKAFWNGMLNELLPELMLPKQGRKSEISIWQISTGESSLLIDMAEAPDIVQDSHSINPYLFLSTPKMNWLTRKVIDDSTTVQELLEAVIISNTKDNLIFILSGMKNYLYRLKTALVFRDLQKSNQKSNSEHKANQFANINIFCSLKSCNFNL